jgi:hypothetical protein
MTQWIAAISPAPIRLILAGAVFQCTTVFRKVRVGGIAQ